MKQTERILGASIILLMLLRLFFNYPYSSLLITLLIVLLSLLYFGFSFALLNKIRFRNLFKKESYNGITTLRIIGTILTGIVLSLVTIYSLFKFQNWPYGNFGLLYSLRLLLIIIIVVLIKFITSKKSFYSNFLWRLGIIGIIATSLYCLSSESLLEMKYRNFPEYVEAEKKSMKDPTNKELERKATEERMKMHQAE